MIDTSCLGLLHLARAVHEHGYKVALTGEGADEWLAGYSWFKINQLTGWLDVIPGLPLGLRRPPGCLTADRPADVPAGDGTATTQAAARRAQRVARPVRHDEPEQAPVLRRRAARADPGRSRRTTTWNCPPTCTAGTRSTGRCTSAPDHAARAPARVARATGWRCTRRSRRATPFLDEDVIAYMARLHPRWKLRGVLQGQVRRAEGGRAVAAEGRGVAAEADVPRPDGHLDQAGARAATTGNGRGSWIEQVLSPESIAKAGYFDPAAVAAARREAGARCAAALGRTGLEMGLTAVTATQLWHHLYISGRPVRDLPRSPGTKSSSLGSSRHRLRIGVPALVCGLGV